MFSSIWPTDWTLSGVTTPGQSAPEREMAMKGCSAFPKASALQEPYDQIVLCHILEARWESLNLLQRHSRCIQTSTDENKNSHRKISMTLCRGNPCYQYDLMMMIMIMMIFLCIQRLEEGRRVQLLKSDFVGISFIFQAATKWIPYVPESWPKMAWTDALPKRRS